MNNVLSTDFIFLNTTSTSLGDFLKSSSDGHSYKYKNLFEVDYLTLENNKKEYYINTLGISSGIENFLLPAKIMKSPLLFLIINIDSYGSTSNATYSNYINTPERVNTIVEWALEHIKKYHPEKKVAICLTHYNYSQIKNNFKDFKVKYEANYREKFGDIFYDVIWNCSQPIYYNTAYSSSINNVSESNLIQIKTVISNFISDYPDTVINFSESDLDIITALFADDVFSNVSVLTKNSIFGLFERKGITDGTEKQILLDKIISAGYLVNFQTKNFKEIYIKMEKNNEKNFINILMKIYKIFGSRYQKKSKEKDKDNGYSSIYNNLEYTYSIVDYKSILAAIPKKFFKRIKLTPRLFLNLFKELNLMRLIDEKRVFFRKYESSSAVKSFYKICR